MGMLGSLGWGIFKALLYISWFAKPSTMSLVALFSGCCFGSSECMKASKNNVMNTVHGIVQLISIQGDACCLTPWHLALSTQKVRFKECLFLLCLSQSEYIRKVHFMRLWPSWIHVKAQKYMFKRKSEQSGLIYKRCTGWSNLIMLQLMV